MIKELLTKYLDTQKIQYETHVDLKKRTWIHRGGIAGIYISPASADELETIVSFLYSEDISFLLIGHTRDNYFSAIFLQTIRINLFQQQITYKLIYDSNNKTYPVNCNRIKA